MQIDGRVLRLLRIVAGLRQVDVARALSIRRQRISELELGQVTPTVAELRGISRLLKVTPATSTRIGRRR